MLLVRGERKGMGRAYFYGEEGREKRRDEKGGKRIPHKDTTITTDFVVWYC